jgi:hypothetical protein
LCPLTGFLCGIERTSWTGLNPIPDVKELLLEKTRLLLRSVQPLPPSNAYRQAIEEIFLSKLQLLERSLEKDNLEQLLNNGAPLEDLLQQIEGEIQLSAKMREWKPWEK